jgi:hypothetical protein
MISVVHDIHDIHDIHQTKLTHTVTLHYHLLPGMQDHLQYDKGKAIPV